MKLWRDRVQDGVVALRDYKDLPDELLVDRILKAAGVRDLVKDQQDLIESALRHQQEAFEREITYTAENHKLRAALAAYRSALRSGEPESAQLRQVGNVAFGLQDVEDMPENVVND